MRKALRTGVLGENFSTLFHRFRFLAECCLFALINNTSSSWHIQTGSIQMNFMGHWAILLPFSIKTKGYIILSILSFKKARKEVVDIIVNVSKKTTAAIFLLKWSTAFRLGRALDAQLSLVLFLFLRGQGWYWKFLSSISLLSLLAEYVPGWEPCCWGKCAQLTWRPGWCGVLGGMTAEHFGNVHDVHQQRKNSASWQLRSNQ